MIFMKKLMVQSNNITMCKSKTRKNKDKDKMNAKENTPKKLKRKIVPEIIVI